MVRVLHPQAENSRAPKNTRQGAMDTQERAARAVNGAVDGAVGTAMIAVATVTMAVAAATFTTAVAVIAMIRARTIAAGAVKPVEGAESTKH